MPQQEACSIQAMFTNMNHCSGLFFCLLSFTKPHLCTGPDTYSAQIALVHLMQSKIITVVITCKTTVVTFTHLKKNSEAEQFTTAFGIALYMLWI